MSDQTNLRIPGPTTLPESVREAGSRQMVNHRGPEFKALLGRVTAGLQRGFRTDNDVLLLTASGTGGLEAMVVNFLSPGDPVLAISHRRVRRSVRGHRHAPTASTSTSYAVEPGRAADPAVVGEHLRAMAAAGTPARAVLVTHNETSTGVTNPLEQIAAAIRGSSPGRAHPRGRHQRPGRRALRDRRMGPRRGRDRLPEELDGRRPAWPW